MAKLTVFVTKYSLAGNIQEVKAEVIDGWAGKIEGRFSSSYKLGRDAFLTKPEAIADFEKRKAKKIKSLEKQISLLKKADPKW